MGQITRHCSVVAIYSTLKKLKNEKFQTSLKQKKGLLCVTLKHVQMLTKTVGSEEAPNPCR